MQHQEHALGQCFDRCGMTAKPRWMRLRAYGACGSCAGTARSHAVKRQFAQVGGVCFSLPSLRRAAKRHAASFARPLGKLKAYPTEWLSYREGGDLRGERR